MIFRTIESIIKIGVFVVFMILLLGFPIIIYGTNPFTFYYELFIKIIDGLKQLKGLM